MNKIGGVVKTIGIIIAVCIVVVFIFSIMSKQKNETAASQTPSTAQSTPETTPKPTISACPNLSSMKLLPYDSLMQSWSAQVFPYKSGNSEVVYTDVASQDIHGNKNIIYCDVGSTEGQNANWIYCGGWKSQIVLQTTDDKGTIINKTSVEVTFDKNTKQYLATKCGTYYIY